MTIVSGTSSINLENLLTRREMCAALSEAGYPCTIETIKSWTRYRKEVPPVAYLDKYNNSWYDLPQCLEWAKEKDATRGWWRPRKNLNDNSSTQGPIPRAG